MAKGAAKPAYSVFRIFNECQKSSAAHNKCAKLLWQLQEKAEDSCFQDICTCLQHILVVAQKEPAVERSVRFVAAFVSWRPEDRSEDCDDFVEQLLTWLLSVAAAKDKAVRYRACQLLFITIENMHVEAGISTELADQLQAAMLERLRDKIPKVREQAARVLTRLGDPGEDGSFANDPVTENLLQLLDIERNKDVRKAVLASLPISDATVGCLMERTRDTSDDVRKMSYAVIAEKVPLTDLSADQWALLLSRGLSDRSAVVRTEATRLLCFWLDKACEKEPLALLAALEVETHEDEAELALKALLAAGALKAISLAHEASASGTGLRRRPEAELMSSEETLLWRVVCEALQGDATTKGRAAAATSGANARVEAAAAGERLEALEAALPETVSALMELAVAHAAAGEEHRFATRQLLHIAARCVDLTDAAGRKAAADMVQKLLREASSGSDRRWDAALVEVARHVYSSHAELAEAMLGAIAEMYARWQLGEPSDAADGEANAAQWVQCLSVASLLLQQVPSARVALALDSLPAGCTSIADLHSLLFMPGVGHPSAAVRAEALRCVGLYCMLEGLPEAPVLQLTILRAVLAAKELALAGSELQDQCVATQALCDLALLRGPKAVDAVYMGLLPRPEASAQAAAGSEPAESSKPLLALLLDCFAKACVVVKPKGRKKAGDMGSDDMPLASAIAEGLAKLLMHQQLWEGPPADAAATKGLEQSDAVKVLSRLLVAYFDPATERAAHLRQCLSVFFHTFAAFSARNQRCLALAFLPAARLALSCGPAKKSPAPLLMRFMLQLLQTPLRSTGDATDDDSNGQLAEALVAEVLACPKGPTSKPYVAGLLKVLVALPLDGTSQPELKRLRAATEQLSKAVSDRMASKDVAAFAKRLAKLDKTPAEGLNEEELAQLLHVMELHDKEPSLQSCPLPFAEASVEATPARARGRNARRVTRVDA
ncbi:hypothetical protein WJX72_008386 [[Myrmecia] bisecta]|uniref:Nuclear condensin complex subunit 3 C-terminal domain-containing protein n=1 Tax=[Myrmecia] bisecta TaxID=41462 RepID=A0AAW1PT96_9CHLO